MNKKSGPHIKSTTRGAGVAVPAFASASASRFAVHVNSRVSAVAVAVTVCERASREAYSIYCAAIAGAVRTPGNYRLLGDVARDADALAASLAAASRGEMSAGLEAASRPADLDEGVVAQRATGLAALARRARNLARRARNLARFRRVPL